MADKPYPVRLKWLKPFQQDCELQLAISTSAIHSWGLMLLFLSYRSWRNFLKLLQKPFKGPPWLKCAEGFCDKQKAILPLRGKTTVLIPEPTGASNLLSEWELKAAWERKCRQKRGIVSARHQTISCVVVWRSGLMLLLGEDRVCEACLWGWADLWTTSFTENSPHDL